MTEAPLSANWVARFNQTVETMRANLAAGTVHIRTGTVTNSTISLSSTSTEGTPNIMSGIGEIKQGEVFPTVPRKGAYLRVVATKTLVRFKEWTGKSTLTDSDGNEYKAAEVEVLTPAIYGFAYDNAVGLPLSGYPGCSGRIAGWRGLNCQFQKEGQTYADEWTANSVAVPAPALNPAAEKPEAKIERLQREKDALEASIHHRMVAEGVTRGWCNEFDPILDATGLPPRHKTNMVTGTMEFTAQINERDYGKAADLIDKIKVAPFSYIANRDIRVATIRVADEDSVGPMLSM